MASSVDFMQFVLDQLQLAGEMTSKKMFGEYAVYCDTKVVGFICDDRLYVKPTDAGRAYIGEVTEGHPYPGSKPYFWIQDQLDDAHWLSGLVRVTAEA